MIKSIHDTEEDEKKIVRDHWRRINLSMPIVAVILLSVGFCLYYDKINFGHYQNIKATDLEDLLTRIRYTLQHSTPAALWLFFCLMYVISKRVASPAILPTSGYEHLTQVANNIFRNSAEHFLMHMTSQLILITYLTAEQTLNLIPTLNLLFILGRILFFFGYPKYRSLGFFIYYVPLMSMMGYIGYRYIKLFS